MELAPWQSQCHRNCEKHIIVDNSGTTHRINAKLVPKCSYLIFQTGLTSRTFDAMANFLTSRHIFDAMTNFLTSWSVLRTFWCHGVFLTSLRIVYIFLTSWRTFWRHDVLLSSWIRTWRVFDVMTNFYWDHDYFWRIFHIMMCFWRPDELFDGMTNFWSVFDIICVFDVMKNVFMWWRTFDVITSFWHHDELLRNFWRHEVFLTSWCVFDILTNFLTSWRVFDIMMNFLTSCTS